MRIAQINMTYKGSTGKIMLQIADVARNAGHEAHTYAPMVFSRVEKQQPLQAQNHFTWGTEFENALHYYAGVVLGQNGRFSHIGTRQLIKELRSFQPEVIHLHNLHGFCVNLPMLFRYIKKEKIKVIWTLHDCWTFTGHCPYFTMCECEKWKTGCYQCPQHHVYPKSYADDSRRMYRLKQKWFLGVENMTLVTPSEWLAGLVKQSFLKDYPVLVINNGIDLDIFKPTESDFRSRFGISDDKFVVLGVAFGWGKRKGLDVFIELAKRLDKQKYQIVLVGTDENTDKSLPGEIISIHRTHNQAELAGIYTAADVFTNPTREENYPTVNMEAIACGTPVITFKTGGSPEIIHRTTGSVVNYDDIDEMEREIVRICETKAYAEAMCIEKAKAFDARLCFEKYIKLYSSV
jgi:glycosyltransferase involved in cell wall biosynthesis